MVISTIQNNFHHIQSHFDVDEIIVVDSFEEIFPFEFGGYREVKGYKGTDFCVTLYHSIVGWKPLHNKPQNIYLIRGKEKEGLRGACEALLENALIDYSKRLKDME